MTTIRKAATDLRVGDYFWYNRELRRVTDVDAHPDSSAATSAIPIHVLRADHCINLVLDP